MGKNVFRPGDWVRIMYGDLKGAYGKVSMHEKNGNYVVLPYNKNDEPGEMVSLANESLELLPAVELEPADFKALVRAAQSYAEYEDKVFPPFNIRPQKKYKMTVHDIETALNNINQTDRPLENFREWFWLILNVFYDSLSIESRLDLVSPEIIPETDNEMFSVVFTMTEKLYWRMEKDFSEKEDIQRRSMIIDNEPDWDGGEDDGYDAEKEGYLAVCRDIFERIKGYKIKKKEPWNNVYSDTQKRAYICECDKKIEKLTNFEIQKYRDFLFDLAHKDDTMAKETLAISYYSGSPAFEQNWNKAEKLMLEVFEKTGSPAMANFLGYIYYYGRTTGGVPDYDRAFKYFTVGMIAGADESIYKIGDMLIYGRGTARNPELGIKLIIDGYADTMHDFCMGYYDNKFADYALRMGNICRDKLVSDISLRDAYRYYLEADFAIKKRCADFESRNDKSVRTAIERELEKIADRLHLDMNRSEVKSNFPLYMPQLFKDDFPLRVEIIHEKNEYRLNVTRFRLAGEIDEKIPLPYELREVPSILTAYPELSYCELVSELHYRLENVSVAKKPKGEYFLSDGFKRNEMTQAIEFYYAGEMVAAIEAEWYVTTVEKNPIQPL